MLSQGTAAEPGDEAQEGEGVSIFKGAFVSIQFEKVSNVVVFIIHGLHISSPVLDMSCPV